MKVGEEEVVAETAFPRLMGPKPVGQAKSLRAAGMRYGEFAATYAGAMHHASEKASMAALASRLRCCAVPQVGSRRALRQLAPDVQQENVAAAS